MPDRTGARLTVAEIFPSYYFAQAGIGPVKGAQAQSDALTAALAYFGSEGVSDDFIALASIMMMPMRWYLRQHCAQARPR